MKVGKKLEGDPDPREGGEGGGRIPVPNKACTNSLQ